MTYGCQEYDITRLCRFDRRAIDQACNGCLRETDKEYLHMNGLWVEGVSHYGIVSEEIETITIGGTNDY